MIAKFSRWSIKDFQISEHPEVASIRHIVLQNPQHEFILIGEGGTTYEHFTIGNILFYNMPSSTKMRFLLNFLVKINLTFMLKPRVVVAAGVLNLIPFGFASSLIRSKFIPIITGEVWYDFSLIPKGLAKFLHLLMRTTLQRANAILTLSGSVKKEIQSKFMLNADKILVYKYKVSPIFNPETSKDLKSSLNPNGPIILTVARISPQKGLTYLVKAAHIIVNEKMLKNVKFVIEYFSSEKNYEEKIREMVKKYNLENNFIFVGNIPYNEMPKYYSAADIFVLPSITEALGIVILEALAMGIPVIASNVGGIKDIIAHGYNGLLVNPKDPVGLVKAIMQVLFDEELKRRLIKGGLATVQDIKENEFEKCLTKFIFES